MYVVVSVAMLGSFGTMAGGTQPSKLWLQVKESLCFVSQDLEGQLHACDPRSSRHKGRQPVNSALAVPQEEYILPDFQTIQVGYVKGKPGDPFLDAPSTAQMQVGSAARRGTAHAHFVSALVPTGSTCQAQRDGTSAAPQQ